MKETNRAVEANYAALNTNKRKIEDNNEVSKYNYMINLNEIDIILVVNKQIE